jgi:choice-of-anchor C domain-containing protein
LVLLAAGVVVLLLIRPWSHADRGAGGGPAGRPATGGPAAGPGGELVVNGSFEDGPEPDPAGPGFTVLEAGSTAVRGWTVTRGSVDHIGPYWQHADGRRSLDLNGNEPGAIAQTLRTGAGVRYRVTFRLAGNNCGDGPPKAVVVSAAGKRAEFTFDATGRNYEDMGWVTKTWEFTATDSETILEFASTTEVPAACGPALDGVSVVEAGN